MSKPSPIIRSLLDTDLYKFTMQQAIRENELDGPAAYELIQRGSPVTLSDGALAWLREAVEAMADLKLQADEKAFLAKTDFFTPAYLDWLSDYRFDPREVSMEQEAGERLKMVIRGPWLRTILWETPLLAIVSEIANATLRPNVDLADFRRRTEEKGRQFADIGCAFVDFGTRRRHSFEAQHVALTALQQSAGNNGFGGTSNLYYARLLNLKPAGTIAHEWIMAHGCRYGVAQADRRALEHWLNVFSGEKTVALSDTYTVDHFLSRFDRRLAQTCSGIRHDSGNPRAFVDKALQHYLRLGINPENKRLIFSDGLDTESVAKIERYVGRRAQTAYGVGTFITHDFPKIDPFDIVIKLTEFDGHPAVKLTDEPSKAVGARKAVEAAKSAIRGT